MSFDRLTICADLINKKFKNYSLLDIGCRTMDLKPFLNNCKEYHGTDILPATPGVYQCDLEKKLEFTNKQFDVITALDILEHLDNPHKAIGELLRVSKKAVYISLPNIFYISFRLRFLFGGGISGKYTFHPHSVIDRHRWILSYTEAIKFIEQNSKQFRVNQFDIIPQRGKAKYILGPIEKYLANFFPNAFVYGVVFEIIVNDE